MSFRKILTIFVAGIVLISIGTASAIECKDALIEKSRNGWTSVERIKFYNSFLFEPYSNEDQLRKKAKILDEFSFMRATAIAMMVDVHLDPTLANMLGIFSRSPLNDKEILSFVSADFHTQNVNWVNHLVESSPNNISLVFSRNDFDEVSIGNWQLDLIRSNLSIFLFGSLYGHSDKDIKKAIRQSTKEYLSTVLKVAKGESKKEMERIEEDLIISEGRAKGFLKELAKEILELDEKAALEKWTQGKGKNRKFKDYSNRPILDQKLIRLKKTSKVYKTIAAEVTNRFKSQVNERFSHFNNTHFEVLDIAQRFGAGTGSLGRTRYYVLIKGFSERPIILDVKEQGETALWPVMPDEIKEFYNSRYQDPETRLINHGWRASEGFRMMTFEKVVYSGWIRLLGQDGNPMYFSVNEVFPFKFDFPLEKLSIKDLNLKNSKERKRIKNRRQDFFRLAEAIGRTGALGQLRADRKFEQANGVYINGSNSFSLAHNISLTVNDRQSDFESLMLQMALILGQKTRDDYELMKDFLGPNSL